jgi:hypothetical protein
VKEALQLLEVASKEAGLVVNESETKYMMAANTQNCSKPGTLEIGRYNFERVSSFICLGLLVTGDINVSEEITNCLIAADRSYFGLKSQFKTWLLSRKTKILIYKTLVRPVLTYTSETWTMTRNNERRLEYLQKENSLQNMWSNM